MLAFLVMKQKERFSKKEKRVEQFKMLDLTNRLIGAADLSQHSRMASWNSRNYKRTRFRLGSVWEMQSSVRCLSTLRIGELQVQTRVVHYVPLSKVHSHGCVKLTYLPWCGVSSHSKI